MSDKWREKATGKLIRLGDGPFEGTFHGAEYVETQYGEALQLKFKTNGGADRILNTKSVRLQGKMSNIPDGTKIKIERFGEGFDTQYEVEVLAKAEVDKVVQQVASTTQEESTWDGEEG